MVFFTMQCFYREDCKRVLHKFPQGFFYIKTNRQNHTQKSRRHLYWKVGSVYLKKTNKQTNKAVHTVGSHF